MKQFRYQVKSKGLGVLIRKIVSGVSAYLVSIITGHSSESSKSELEQFASEFGVPYHNRLLKVCKKFNIPFKMVKTLDHPDAISFVKNSPPDFCVYLGGGILREVFLSEVKHLVLNAHSGPLPQIRGMNAVQWSLFKGIAPATSLHCIDKGVDTGEIYDIKLLPILRDDSLETLIERSTVQAIQILLEGVEQLFTGHLMGSQQKKNQGQQFFVMHEFLVEICRKRLNSLQTSIKMESFDG